MKYLFLPALFILSGFTHSLNANELTRYMENYQQTGDSDYKKEKDILQNIPLPALISELENYYKNPSEKVTRKAFYLTYKKGIHTSTKNPAAAINILASACLCTGHSIANTNLGYLQQFQQHHFNTKTKEILNQLLQDKKYAHNKKLILLAGYVGTGKEILIQSYNNENTPEQTKYYISHALARMGNPEHIKSCLKNIKAQPINNNTMDYAVPMAIYTRQKELTDYCIKILESKEKLCSSPNPDYAGDIRCGYKVVELLAHVIHNFPVTADASGITNMSYEEALNTARKWFKENRDYTLDTTIY